MAGACCTPGRGGSERPDDAVEFDGPTPDLVALPSGTFLMGSEDPEAYPLDLEGPVREVHVDEFSISATTVTVEEFAEFVRSTGYVTDAERFGDSLVFAGSLPAGDDSPVVPATPWWRVVDKATWRTPAGPSSTVDAVRDLPDHPVTHVSRRDAEAYGAWTGTALPSEEQWEYAARGGLVQKPFPWGDDADFRRMNTWEGEFPGTHTDLVLTCPSKSYKPNGYGLFNCTGNVWEWTTGMFDASRRDSRAVIRGGSHLCHISYCRRYRTSARSGTSEDTSSSHTGFRVCSR